MTDSIAVNLLSELFDAWDALPERVRCRIRTEIPNLRRALAESRVKRRFDGLIENAPMRGIVLWSQPDG